MEHQKKKQKTFSIKAKIIGATVPVVAVLIIIMILVVVYDFQQNHFDKCSKPVRIVDQLSVREYRRVVK